MMAKQKIKIDIISDINCPWCYLGENRLKNAIRQTADRYNFDKQTKVHNTFNGYRLIWLAGKHGLQEQVTDALYRSNFAEGENLNDVEFLTGVGVENGIPAEDLTEFFGSDKGKDEVKAMEYEANQAGITGVPAFVLNDKYLISGAQGVETFVRAFDQLGPQPE